MAGGCNVAVQHNFISHAVYGVQSVRAVCKSNNAVIAVIGNGGNAAGIGISGVVHYKCAARGDVRLLVANAAYACVAANDIEGNAVVHGGVTATSEDTNTIGDIEGTAVYHYGIAIGNVDAASNVTVGLDTAVKSTGIDNEGVATATLCTIATYYKVIGGSIGTAVYGNGTAVRSKQANFAGAYVTATANGEYAIRVYGEACAVLEGYVITAKIQGELRSNNDIRRRGYIRAEHTGAARVCLFN